jgi:hypothetical protein
MAITPSRKSLKSCGELGGRAHLLDLRTPDLLHLEAEQAALEVFVQVILVEAGRVAISV